jgi:hypothetical protein
MGAVSNFLGFLTTAMLYYKGKAFTHNPHPQKMHEKVVKKKKLSLSM